MKKMIVFLGIVFALLLTLNACSSTGSSSYKSPSSYSSSSSSSSKNYSSSGSSYSSSGYSGSSSSSSSNSYGYGKPRAGESFSDYVKREDPELYYSMKSAWDSMR